MAIKQLNPYLNFNGDGAQAIALYERALGAKAINVQRFGDAPGMSTPENKDRILHARLEVGPAMFMLSDTRPGQTLPPGGNTHLCLDFTDATEMAQKFDALAVGGKVTMPLADTFWGARFGTLEDAHGIQWMFNCDLKKG